MNIAFTSDGRQWAWNSTSLGLAKDCPRKYFYVVILGWQPKSLNDNITFGYYYARALELYHIARSRGVPYEDTLRYVVEQTLRDTATWRPEQSVKTRETLIRSIIWYLEEFRDDPCKTVILGDGQPAVELTFQFPINDRITFCGHIDRLISYAGGDYYIQDQKTTGASLGPYYFRRYTPDNQMSLYTVAGQVVWKLPIKGVIIDAAQIAVGFTRFERGFAYRTSEQLEEWIEDAKFHIDNIWRAAAKDWPMNDSACQKYGGCQFLGICSKSPQVRQEFLESGFERRPMTILEPR